MQYLKVLRQQQKPQPTKNSVSCEIIQKWRRNFFKQKLGKLIASRPALQKIVRVLQREGNVTNSDLRK